MDKIWDRNSFEVGGHWPLKYMAGMKKLNDHAEPIKVERKKKTIMFRWTYRQCYQSNPCHQR